MEMMKIYDYFEEIEQAELFQLEEYGEVHDEYTCDHIQWSWEDLREQIENAFDSYAVATPFKWEGETLLNEEKSILDVIYGIRWDVDRIYLTDRSIIAEGKEIYISNYVDFDNYSLTDKEERHKVRQFFKKVINPIEVWQSYMNGGVTC